MSRLQLLLVGMVEAGGPERLEHLVGGDAQRARTPAAGDPAERVREEGLADADGADDRDVGVRVDEAQRRGLVPQRSVVGDLELRDGGRLQHFQSDDVAIRHDHELGTGLQTEAHANGFGDDDLPFRGQGRGRGIEYLGR